MNMEFTLKLLQLIESIFTLKGITDFNSYLDQVWVGLQDPSGASNCRLQLQGGYGGVLANPCH